MRAVIAFFIGIVALAATHDVVAQSASAKATADQLDPAAAVRAANNRFAGVWKLVGEETRDARGEVVPGPNARSGGRVGYIVYDPAGYMSVNLAWPSRPELAGRQPTPDEARVAMSTYNSYWGSFAVNEASSIVTHQTFGALSPAFSGTNQERKFTIDGNRLTLRPPTASNGDQRTLIWERVPDLPKLTPLHRKLIGFWKLISFERRNAKGDLLLSYPGQTGFLVYTASGHVMVHMMQPYRRRNVGPSPTPEETMATYLSYTSYFGPYTVNESDQYVVHHIASAFNSGRVGTDFQRVLEFPGKQLILKPPVTKNGDGEEVRTTITWERLSD
jgi:lipocalin-like protein